MAQGADSQGRGSHSSEDRDYDGADVSHKQRGRTGIHASRHLAAEKRRRGRINERLDRLRELVPHDERASTAIILDNTYDYIKKLQTRLTAVDPHAADIIDAPTSNPIKPRPRPEDSPTASAAGDGGCRTTLATPEAAHAPVANSPSSSGNQQPAPQQPALKQSAPQPPAVPQPSAAPNAQSAHATALLQLLGLTYDSQRHSQATAPQPPPPEPAATLSAALAAVLAAAASHPAASAPAALHPAVGYAAPQQLQPPPLQQQQFDLAALIAAATSQQQQSPLPRSAPTLVAPVASYPHISNGMDAFQQGGSPTGSAGFRPFKRYNSQSRGSGGSSDGSDTSVLRKRQHV